MLHIHMTRNSVRTECIDRQMKGNVSVVLVLLIANVISSAPTLPGVLMSPTVAAPGLESVWHSLDSMVREARDTGQTELEVR